jgi:hypothetical protein
MPDRVVRDELLTSERYWRCSAEARCLYVSLLLSVDDAARYTGAPFALRTRCMAGTVSHERIEVILAELVDADLVRRYERDGKPYLFVPRFRNRSRYIASSKYPEPPSEINDIVQKKSDSSQTQDRPKSDSSQTQDSHARAGVGVGVEVGVKTKPMPEPPAGLDPKIWESWCRYRGGKLKGETLRLTYKHIGEWLAAGHDVTAIIERSIANGWTGLFPPDKLRPATLVQRKVAL